MAKEKDISKMVDEIFDKFNIEGQIEIVEELVEQMEKIISADDMWENAMMDESSRRVLAAAIGVVALKFGEVSSEMIDFLNDETK